MADREPLYAELRRAAKWWRVAIVLSAIALAFVPVPARHVEHYYSDFAYLVLQRQLTSVSNAAPFALGDLFGTAVILAWLGLTVADFARAAVGWWRALVHFFVRTAVLTGFLYLAFLAIWGLNYRREPLTEKLRFARDAVSPAAAREMAAVVIERVNVLYEPAHAEGTDRISPSLADAFARVQRELGAPIAAVPGRPKPTLLDFYFRRAGVDGMTEPYFLETLVAGDLLPVERPFVLAHEWSHLAGYADEGEANFVGWLVSVRAGGAAEYSGWLFLYGEVMGAVAPADRRQLPALGPGPRADRQAIARRLQRHVNPRVARAGWMVYDHYLRANRVEAGAASYRQVVQLALGTRFGPGWIPLLK